MGKRGKLWITSATLNEGEVHYRLHRRKEDWLERRQQTGVLWPNNVPFNMGLSSLFWERPCYCSDFIMLCLGHFSPLVPGGHTRSGPWAICSQRVRFTLRACSAASPWAKLEACVHFKPSSSVHLPCTAIISHCSAGFRESLDASEE